jgi:hypothetical protein
MLAERDETSWYPAKLLDDIDNPNFKFALLVLNQPILSSPDIVLSLWNRGMYICV